MKKKRDHIDELTQGQLAVLLKSQQVWRDARSKLQVRYDRSKYMPHQGARECARRQKKLDR